MPGALARAEAILSGAPLPDEEEESTEERKEPQGVLARADAVLAPPPPEPEPTPEEIATRERVAAMKAAGDEQWEQIEEKQPGNVVAETLRGVGRTVTNPEVYREGMQPWVDAGSAMARSVMGAEETLQGAIAAGGEAVDRVGQYMQESEQRHQEFSGLESAPPSIGSAVSTAGERIQEGGERGAEIVAKEIEEGAYRRPENFPADLWQGLAERPVETLTMHGLENFAPMTLSLGAMVAGGWPAVLTAGLAQEGGAAWNEAKAADASDDEALKAFVLTGFGNMALEALPAAAAIRRFAGNGVPKDEVARMVAGFAEQAVAEGVTESVQEFNNILVSTLTYAEDHEWSWDDVKRIGAAGVIGAVIGGPVGLATSGTAPQDGTLPPTDEPVTTEQEVPNEVRQPQVPRRQDVEDQPGQDAQPDEGRGVQAREQPDREPQRREGLDQEEVLEPAVLPPAAEAEPSTPQSTPPPVEPRPRPGEGEVVEPAEGEIQFVDDEGAMEHAGSPVSPEAINRERGGTRFYEVSPSGETTPMIGPEAVDQTPRRGFTKVRVSPNGEAIVESGSLNRTQQEAVDRLTVPRETPQEATQEPEADQAPAPQEQTQEGATQAQEQASQEARPVDIAEISPQQIDLEPERFQFKLDRDAVGSTGSLAGVSEWDPNLAGVVSAWRDPSDNRLKVINGHNRVAKARQLQVPSIRIMEIDAESAKEARAVGAMQNIAEGHGTPVDAAKFFRDSGMIEEEAIRKLPLSQATVDQGLGLAGLSDFLFGQVTQGELAPQRGSIIGRHLRGKDDLQNQLYKEISKRERRQRVTNDMVEDIARRMESTGTVSEESAQVGLFGDTGATERSLAFEEADIAADIRTRLRRQKSAFSNAARNAPMLSEAGNVIDQEMSRGISEQAAVNLAVFDKLRNTTEIGGIISEAARDLATGKESADAIKTQAFERIREAVGAALGQRTQESGAGVSEVEEGGSGADAVAGQGGLFDEGRERLAARIPDTTGESREGRAPEWLSSEAETKVGNKLVRSIRKDPEGQKTGLRSIGDFLVEATRSELRVGSEQTTRSSPAHYEPSPHIIRSRAGNNLDYMSHEVGHSLSALVRDKNPKAFNSAKTELVALTQRAGSLASRKSAEEGLAEWVRLSVVDPAAIADLPVTEKLESVLKKEAPDTLAALRDAARAHQAHRGRQLFSRFRSHSRTRPTPKKIASQIRDAWHRVLFLAAARRSAIDRMDRNVWRAAMQAAKRGVIDRKMAQASVRSYMRKIKDTDADLRSAYQSVLHGTQEVEGALLGRGKKERQGLRIRKTGEGAMLDEDAVAALRSAGLPVPDAAGTRHGDWLYLTDTSAQDIVERLGDDWADFETYAQARVALDRFEAKEHQYPGWPHDPTPDELRKLVEDGSAREGFTEAFDDFQEYADGLLSVGVLGGMVNPEDAVRMKEAYNDYLPLIREQERELGFKGGSDASRPSPGFHRARGGQQPFLPLLDALELRTNQVLGAYYANRAVLAPIKAAEVASKDAGLPKDVRDVVARVATRLKLDTKAVAKLTPEEGRKVIANYLNKEAADTDEVIRPEDIDVHWNAWEVWRAEEPKAIRIVAPVINGKRVFYQVEDQILYDLFAHTGGEGGRVSEIFDLFANWAVGMRRPWKRVLTQNIVFATRNIVRDSVTGNFFGEGVESFIPGFFSMGGIVRQLTGKTPEGSTAGEMLSRAFETTHSPAHRARVSKFQENLREGVIPDDWRRMEMPKKISEMLGPIPMAAAMKPVELGLWASGQRHIAQLTEEASRLEAYARTLNRGGSHEAAQQAYDYVTGNFGDQPASHFLSQLYRIPGFVNPAVQITYEIGNRLTHPDPKVRAAHWIKAAPWLMLVTAIGWGINRLITPDDREEELKERPDEDRMSYMAIGGHFRVPFDYGLLGAVQSWTWNSLDTVAGDGPRGKIMARLLLRRATDLPVGGPMSFMQPQIKALLENEANYQWHWASEIEPHWMKYLPPEDRAYWSTPKVYRFMAKHMGVGPLKIQHFVQAGMAYQLDEAVRWLDRMERGEKIEEPADVPFVGRLIQQTPQGWRSSSVQEIAELDRKYSATKGRLNALIDDPSSTEAEIEAAETQLYSLEAFHYGMQDVSAAWKEAKELRQAGDAAGAREMEGTMTETAARVLREAVEANPSRSEEDDGD